MEFPRAVRLILFPVAAAVLLILPGLPAARADEAHPTPRFTHADRREKLAAAFPEIERYLAGRMQSDHVPGMAFGIVIDGELAYGKGLGVRDVTGKAPVDLDTAFRIASMTKSFTALAILKLRDEGRLSLEDPVSKHIKELAALPYPTKDSAPLTLRMLLTHSTGFPEDNPWGDRQLAVSDAVLSRWMSAGIPFSNPPGTAFEYSNYAFAILGQVVTRASGMRYRDYVEQKILRPLGMTSTHWEASAVPPEHLAHGYQWKDGAWKEEPPLPDGAFGAMGGLITTGHDLARYVAFLLSAWPARDEPDNGPVKRSSIREMQQNGRFIGFSMTRATPDAPARVTSGNYGFGIGFSEDCDTRLTVAHSGGLPGFGSVMRMLPEHGVAVFILGNRTYTPAGSMAREATDALARTGGLAARERPASPVLLETRDTLASLLERWDEATVSALAADNLALDRPLPERRDEMATLHERHGTCRPGDVDPENWLRGRFRETCERGWVDVEFTMAPTNPPRVQSLRWTSGLPPSARLSEVAKAVASLASTWDETAASALAAPALDRARLQTQLHAVGERYGACRVGEALDGDGARSARLHLDCDRGSLDLSLGIDEGGRLATASFAAPRNTTCVP